MALTELNWTGEKPTVRGLYWRRNGKNDKPQLAVVFKGAHGLMVRIVTEPNRPKVSSDDKPVDRPIESFTSGEWAGPLGPPNK